MRSLLPLAIVFTNALLLCSGIAGMPPPPENLTAHSLPSLEQRVRESDLIVCVHLEARKGEVVGRITAVLKGNYSPIEHPNDPKGYFAFGIPVSQYNWDHEEEIWFLEKPELLNAPADSQTDPASVVFRGAKVYNERLELPVYNGVVKYPTVGRRYKNEVISTANYKATEFIALIRAITKKTSRNRTMSSSESSETLDR